jgi:hypothetical protein
MLHGGADAGKQDKTAQCGITLRCRQPDEGQAREHRTRGQQRPLAQPLSKHACGHLQQGERCGIGRPQSAHLSIAEAKGLAPDRQQYIQGITYAVVNKMSRAGGRKCAPLLRPAGNRMLADCHSGRLP